MFRKRSTEESKPQPRRPARAGWAAGTLAGLLCAAALALAPAGLAGCHRKNSGLGPSEVEQEKTTFSVDQHQAPFRIFADYRIAPGDVLDVLYQITTWKEQKDFRLAIDDVVSVKFVNVPELNEEQAIRPDGTISLPYLGQIYVVGTSVGALTAELKSRYSKILKSPELYVTVPEFRSAIKALKQDLHTAPRGLSRLVTVRPDGRATFAMVGDLDVANKTVPQVSRTLNDKYALILPGLSVDLFLETHSGSLIYVLGQVYKPGAYNILKPTTIVQALALAGSAMPTARLESVVVVRRHEDKLIGTRVDVTEALELQPGGKSFYLEPDDIVYVPKRRISRMADVTRDIADVIFFRGWGANLGFSYRLDSSNSNSGN